MLLKEFLIDKPHPFGKISEGPEGPEIKRTADFLNYMLENKAIIDWNIFAGRYITHLPYGFDKFEEQLPLLVESVKAKGKLLYFTLYNENGRFYIVQNIRNSGKWQTFSDNTCQWIIELNTKENLWFRDPKCTGTIFFTKRESDVEEELNKLGIDILSSNFTLPVWKDLLNKHKDKNITVFLTDQEIICGCGNYIKSEVLYYSRISPLRIINTFKDDEVNKLFEALIIIPRLSYNCCGLTMRDNSDYDPSYIFDLQIYNKRTATKTKTPDGKTTYWDPTRQH